MFCVWQGGRTLKIHPKQKDAVIFKAVGESSEDVQLLKLTIGVYRAEALPKMDGVMTALRKKLGIDLKDGLKMYVQVNFGDLEGKTTKEKKVTTVCWNQQITFVVKFPFKPLPVTFLVKNDDLMVDSLIGMAEIGLKKISKADNGGFLPTFGPAYVHLHSPKDRKYKEKLYQGKLLVSLFSEIIIDTEFEKPYVGVEETTPLPEEALVKDFLLFACLRDATMIDSKLAEKKNIRFTLHSGNDPEDSSPNRAFACPFESILNLEKEIFSNDLCRSEEIDKPRDAENCTPLFSSVKRNRKYGYLPIEESKPCFSHVFSSTDSRVRMYIANVLEKVHCKISYVLDNLHERLMFKTLDKGSIETILMSFKADIVHYSEVLKTNWEKLPSKTQLDRERQKIYENIVGQLVSILQTKTTESDHTIVKTILDRIENVFQEFVGIMEDPQASVPDVIVWMEINQKRVAFSKVCARDILHSPSVSERGRLSGRIVSMLFRPTSTRSNESITAKVDVYLWLGLLRNIKHCLKSLPRGFDVTSSYEVDGTNVPRFLEYDKKQTYQLRAYIYQARSLSWPDPSSPPGFFAQVLAGGVCRRTAIRENSMNPIWDETLVLRNLLFFGFEAEMDVHQPEIVVEVHGLGWSDQSVCVCREVIPVSRSRGQPPLLRYHHLASADQADPPAQILAAFEVVATEGRQGGDASHFLEGVLEDIGPPLPIPSSIRPRFAPHRVEVLFWGLRGLRRVNLQALEAPRLELEVGGQTVLRSSVILDYKKHSNFVRMVEAVDVELPERESYLPNITIRLQDCKSFGRRATLASHVIHSLSKYVFEAEGEVLKPKFEDRQGAYNSQSRGVAIQMEDIDEDPLQEECSTVSMKVPWTTPRKGIEMEEGEEDWWTRYHISSGGIEQVASDNSTGRSSHSERRKTIAELVIEDKKAKSPQHLDPRAFVIYPCELENVPQFGGFEEWLHSFQLTNGNELFSRFTRADRKKTVAVFKGCFRVYKLPLPPRIVDPRLPSGNAQDGLFSGLPENRPVRVLVRVYAVRAVDLAPSDITNTTDPYIVIEVGHQRLSDKDGYISKQLNPVFGKCFEFEACFPGDAVATVRVMDWDLMGKDDLIGETRIDLENRFYSRCRPACGLARAYEEGAGPNAWRDAMTPSEILSDLCRRSGLGTPVVRRNAIQITGTEYSFAGGADVGEQDMALHLLHRWREVSRGGHPLVPEHLETRTLHHPSRPGEARGTLLMWVDMFPEAAVPPGPPRDISPRRPVGFELRAVVWNAEDVVLADDAFLTGERMSDIYVTGRLTGKEDAQRTDIHYRSLTGEGNFNWRFVFPFDYLTTERKIVVTRKASVFSWDESEFKVAPQLTLEVWDADHFKRDDHLGKVDLHLCYLPRGAMSPERCSLKQLEMDAPQISLFKQRRARGWWPVAAEGPTGQRELTGKIEVELQLLTREEADLLPVGLGRREPEALEEPRRPSASFVNYLHPLKTFRYALWKRYRRKIVVGLVVSAVALFFLLFVYSIPGYAAMKILRN